MHKIAPLWLIKISDYFSGVLSTGAIWFFLSKQDCPTCAVWTVLAALGAVVLLCFGMFLDKRNMRIRREVRQSVYPFLPSSSHKASYIRITNHDNVAVTVFASAFAPNWTPIGKGNVAVGTLEPNRQMVLRPSELEELLAYMPDSTPTGIRVRIAITGSLKLEVEHFERDQGELTKIQPPEGALLS